MSAWPPAELLRLALRVVALLALLVAILLPRASPAPQLPKLVGLVDVSSSMPADQAPALWRQIDAQARQLPGTGVETRLMAADVWKVESAQSPWPPLDREASDIGRALAITLTTLAATGDSAIVMLTDGQDTGSTLRESLEQARGLGLPVYWLPVAGPARPHIATVTHAPAAQQGADTTVRIDIAGTASDDLMVRAAFDGESFGQAPVVDGAALLSLTPSAAGTRRLQVQLLGRGGNQVLDTREPAGMIEVLGAPPVLLVARTETPLSQSLRNGGWSVERLEPQQLVMTRDELARFKVLILDDVHFAAPPAQFWSDLDHVVRERGLGLLVLGGPRSFGAGGYRDTILEALLPVDIAPPDNSRAAALLFAIDSSGSMDSRSRGVDRLSYARAATLTTVRASQAGDRIAALLFDTEPRLLLPWTDARAAAAALPKIWNARASGGTRLRATLARAAQLLTEQPIERRILILVTDGYTSDELLTEEIAALGRSRIEVLALAIGPDAQIARLNRLLAPIGGQVLRVAEVAELPQFMRGSLDARRGAVARGQMRLIQSQTMPFATRMQSWPPVAAYAVTRANKRGTVWLRSERGDPVLAGAGIGIGRVAVHTAGAGAWAPDWATAADFGAFAGGALNWLRGVSSSSLVTVEWDPRAAGFAATADVSEPAGWVHGELPSATLRDQTGRSWPLKIAPVGPGRFRIEAPAQVAGLLQLDVSAGNAKAQLWHFKDSGRERQGRGLNPVFQGLQLEGLLQPWPANGVQALMAPRTAAGLSLSRRSLWIALLAFLAALALDVRGVWIGLRAPRNWSLTQRYSTD